MPHSKASFDKFTPLKNFQLVFLLVLALGLMIQSWGDRAGFLSHPARTGFVAVVAMNVFVLLFIPFEFFTPGMKEIPRQRWATFLALGVVALLCWFLPYADRRSLWVWPESNVLRYCGLGGVVVGLALRVIGTAQLGPHFSGFVAIQEEHPLLTTGCYRWVRHPIYSGSLLAFAGFLLVFRSQMILVVLPLYLAGTLWRITDEERLLTEVFGPAYEEYRARSWRLVPFVY
jgi:protein-S-isoprenylcysteine O-methyltransferase Ste14